MFGEFVASVAFGIVLVIFVALLSDLLNNRGSKFGFHVSWGLTITGFATALAIRWLLGWDTLSGAGALTGVIICWAIVSLFNKLPAGTRAWLLERRVRE